MIDFCYPQAIVYSFFIDDEEQTWISYNQESDLIVYDITDDVVKEFVTQDEEDT